jgi:DNA primase
MLTYNDKQKVISILDDLLGVGTSLKNNERVHYCPFCNHHKKKLNVNLETQKYHCWVCDTKGNRIYSLLKKLKAGKQYIDIINQIYNDGYLITKEDTDDVQPKQLFLPKEFISLTKPNPKNPHYIRAIKYLTNRGISHTDIIKYNIGYCETGDYKNRIIIPSYDKNNMLNYFIARSFYKDEKFKYKNPPIGKNIVALENQINWKEPITICEGIFDAIAIKRNAIPLFGKFIPKKLLDSIYLNGVKKIYIMLDTDAQKEALYYVDMFSKQDIEVVNIEPQEKDPSEMGFSKNIELIKGTNRTTYRDIISQKLKLI